MTKTKMFEIGEVLYNEYRLSDNYSVGKDFFVDLSLDDENQVKKGFISQRKTVEPNASEQDHEETYWAMLDELQ